MDEQTLGRLDADDVASMAEALRGVLTADDDGDAGIAAVGIARRCGFDGLSYLVVRAGTVGLELLRHWTTARPQWKAWYREHLFHRVDPRVTLTHDRSAPLAWQHAGAAAAEGRGSFAAAATASGIGSGLAMSLQQMHGERAIIAWDRREVQTDAAIRHELANLALLGCLLHERVVGARWPASAVPPATALTERECECLTRAACGLTSADIGVKLGIAERTVNFHIGNIVRKLGVLNRAEAIARGVALDLVRLQR
ncbi:MAG: autoinducer binding domain-containing protein [Burkholderiales bacterium]|nr:autoinducer binding domain-containing protein [Burkholderiales bacterium]